MSDSGFNARIMLWVVGATIASFVGYLFLSAYAPDMQTGRDGRGHVLSRSAIGYSAVVRLQQERGRSPAIIRRTAALTTQNLVVVMPEFGMSPSAIETLIAEREGNPTLIILPKRITQPDPLRVGWVHGRTLGTTAGVEQLMQRTTPMTVNHRRGNRAALRFTADWSAPITFPDDAVVQTISGPDIIGYITDEAGNILLGGIKRSDDDDDYVQTYILSDPDVMNNLGMARPDMAYAATTILDELAQSDDGQVDFDATLNGFETTNNLLKLVFEPPFLALSLCLFFAAMMALANGLMRFGPPFKTQRAIAPGKRALIDNSADLLRLAEREHEVGARYGAVTRDLAVQALGLPSAINAAGLNDRLDSVTKTGPAFSVLVETATRARSAAELLVAAQALFAWRKEKTS